MANERFFPQEIIRRKRDGKSLTDSEIGAIVSAITDESMVDSQIAAFAMAVLFQGMNPRECSSFSLAMRDSGNVLNWNRAHLHGPVIDKHSSGGVGDCVSLMLAPMLAACGAHVPMISGRGLGHSGGTLDKLSSIPGYCSGIETERFQAIVENVGCAIVGQSKSLAPADGRMYAVRDISATVESVPLITASILSKKLAAGIDALVMDVKTGNGAFAATNEMAVDLANSIVSVASVAGVSAVSLVTDMDEPLAPCAGNALEILEVVDYLVGERRDPRLHAVVLALGSELLVLSGIVPGKQDAINKLEQILADGSAVERFSEMIASLGGPNDLIERPARYLDKAPVMLPVLAKEEGIVSAIDARELGMVVVALGGGRVVTNDDIDTSVGLTNLVRIGDEVVSGKEVAVIHARTKSDAEAASDKVLESLMIGSKIPESAKLIRGIYRGAT
ncbi:MAG: thymidine phosphorylase [Acidiferrobacteraceae bacterium]|nr:thymidine phosphorylase [Acidiferrobacteraceae bacterium]